ncbi:MAG TPA: hypothetical protein EYO84_02865 [Planctomycetes bacterium]|nr:hypothetical protein [Planctomycetota bacterium]
MPETAMTNDHPGRQWSQQIVSDPRLRAGRLRIRRHAFLRGAVTGIWITLPVSALLWIMTSEIQSGLFNAISLLVVGASISALYQRFRVRALWPRIWDSTLESTALVETILHCHRDRNEDPWGESLRARSAQLPLPSHAALHRLAPFPSPLISLTLTLMALMLGSLQDPLPDRSPAQVARINAASGSSGELVDESSLAADQSISAQLLRGREDAALALAGRTQLAQLTEHLRQGSAPPQPPPALLGRDRKALETALGRLLDSDPRRQLLERWIATDRPVGERGSVPIPGIEASGAPIARGATPGSRSGSLSGDLASGGSDSPRLLEPVSSAPPGVEELDEQIRIDGGIVTEGDTPATGRAPTRSDSSSSWDRVRDDPRLEPRWIEVIDLYWNLLRGRERDGGG